MGKELPQVTPEETSKSQLPDEMLPTNAESILRLKEAIRLNWEQLPAEHQATMGLVLMARLLHSEWAQWFRTAMVIHLSARTLAEGRTKTINVLRRVTRADLKRVGFTHKEIRQLSEDDLKAISLMITEHLRNDAFWDELKYHVELILQQKRDER